MVIPTSGVFFSNSGPDAIPKASDFFMLSSYCTIYGLYATLLAISADYVALRGIMFHGPLISTRREFSREILAIITMQHIKIILSTPSAIFPILLSEIHSSPSANFPIHISLNSPYRG